MEQGGISIMSPPGVTETSVGKSKSIGITLRSNGSVKQTAKEKLKAPWMKNLVKTDTTLWDTFLSTLGELIGTAILVLVGCMGCVGSLGMIPSHLQIALTFGIAVMVAIQCVGHISGAHINPAITTAAVILGEKSLPIAALYIVAQCLGGLIGYGLLKLMTPLNLLHTGDSTEAKSFCATSLNHSLSAANGVAAELFATAILTFFACGVWDSRNAKNTDSTAIRFGLCVTVLCLAFAPYTGCSLNPARTLAPAIWNGYWTDHWIYWIGPLAGAVITASLYRFLFLPRNRQEQDSTRDPGTLNGIET